MIRWCQRQRGWNLCCLLLVLFGAATSFRFGRCPWVSTNIHNRSSSHRHAVALASSSKQTSTETNTIEQRQPPTQQPSPSKVDFVSTPMQVYIEDTDAYGILYNTNYLRAYDRALQAMKPKNTLAGDNDNKWSIVSFGEQKFRISPVLGQDYVVKGVRKQDAIDQKYELWDMQMTSVGGSIVFNTISDLKISAPENEESSDETAEPSLSSSNTDTIPYDNLLKTVLNSEREGMLRYQRYKQIHTVYRDEMNAYSGGNQPCLYLRSVLNYFERCRSFALGGPDALRRLQVEDGILAVVTGIRSCALTETNGAVVMAGDSVMCETVCVPKRNGRVLECYQSLFSTQTQTSNDDDAPKGDCIAVAHVSLMLLDTTTRKPIRGELPQWILDLCLPVVHT